MSEKDPNQAAFDKTAQIFQELCPNHYKNLLDPLRPKSTEIGQELAERVSRVFAERFGQEKAREFAIHVTGFPSDTAFLVALFLFPERFTDDEVAAGIRCFGIEASHHAVAIAKMLNYTDEK
ncbi:MAG: hypothetical protein ACAI34_01930 [Verrucomicrobium sp.]